MGASRAPVAAVAAVFADYGPRDLPLDRAGLAVALVTTGAAGLVLSRSSLEH